MPGVRLWIEPMLPQPKARGRPLKYPGREIVNALFYISKRVRAAVIGGCCLMSSLPGVLCTGTLASGMMLDCSSKSTLCYAGKYAYKQVKTHNLQPPSWTASLSRRRKKGAFGPTLFNPTSSAPTTGVDAGKRIKGRKRHILVDAMGLVLMVVATAASVQDRDGAKRLIELASCYYTRIMIVWADAAYSGEWLGWVWKTCRWFVQTMRRDEGVKRVPCSAEEMDSGADIRMVVQVPQTCQRLRIPAQEQRSIHLLGYASSDATLPFS